MVIWMLAVEEYYFLGCDAVYCIQNLLTYRNNLLLPISRLILH
jgi:hypothetical protein